MTFPLSIYRYLIFIFIVECGAKQGPQFRITGGERVEIGQLPSLALAFADITGRRCTATIGKFFLFLI